MKRNKEQRKSDASDKLMLKAYQLERQPHSKWFWRGFRAFAWTLNKIVQKRR